MASNNLKAQKQLLDAGMLEGLSIQLRQGGRGPAHLAKLLYALGTGMRNYTKAAAAGFELGVPSLGLGLLQLSSVRVQKRAVCVGVEGRAHAGCLLWCC